MMPPFVPRLRLVASLAGSVAAGLTSPLAAPVAAQSTIPTDTIERRFRFAELYTGVDLTAMLPGEAPGSGIDLPTRAIPRATIAGLHFWGHADFAVSFPLMRGSSGDGPTRVRRSTGIETRGRWYVRPVRQRGLSPFVGGGFAASDLQIGDGPRRYRIQPMAQAGLVWRSGGTLIEAGASLRPTGAQAYPISRTATVPVRPGAHQLFVGVHRLFETTAGLATPIRSGAWGARERALRAAGRLSGPTLAVGLSSPILTGGSSYTQTVRPYLFDRPRSGVMPDLGLGWHFEGARTQVNLAVREARFRTAAFGVDQRMQRRSLALEAFTFLGDWHGFVPFIGPAVSLERLQVRETDGGVRVTDVARSPLAAGVTFGWDIRPTASQPWLLRTNLRWFPSLRVPMPTGVQRLDQLEFNFIQLVWYPRR